MPAPPARVRLRRSKWLIAGICSAIFASRWSGFANGCSRSFSNCRSRRNCERMGWWSKFRSGQRASADEARKRAVYDNRRQRFEAAQRLKQAGWSIKQIARP
jgi:hypothetical protein